MPCCRKLLRAVLCSLWLAALAAQAAEIGVANPQLTASDDGYGVAADFDIKFNASLEEAVNKGVVLYFAADFELSRSRWYWFDEQILRRSKTFQLSYHALTRQYRLSTGALHQSYPTLDDALRVLSHLRNWQVLEKGQVKPGQQYLAGLRLRLDLTQMAKTFQVSALANRDWNLSSDWLRWTFAPAEAAHAAPSSSAPAGVSGPAPLAAPPAPLPPANGEPAAPANGDAK
jgi:hypothetical protein